VHGGVAVEADPEEIAGLAGLGEITQMADVKEIEAAVGRARRALRPG
jgi:hypothetical protein